MGRTPCCAKEGLNKGPWTEIEDKTLIEYINTHGEGKWRNLPKKAGLMRCGKSCRLRWLNYLRPGIKRGNITPDEEELIIKLHKLLGNRWSLIAGRLPGRTDNEIKNYWNTNLGKRVNQLDHRQNTHSSTCNKQLKKPSNNQKNKNVVPTNQPTPVYNVVRSKAIRCSKVIINPPEPPQPQPQLHPHPTSNNNTNHTNKNNSSINNHSTVEEENIMSDDFNMGDLNLIAELLNSEFSEVCDISYECSSNNNDNDLLSPNSLDQPFVFSQDMLEDWLSLEFNK